MASSLSCLLASTRRGGLYFFNWCIGGVGSQTVLFVMQFTKSACRPPARTNGRKIMGERVAVQSYVAPVQPVGTTSAPKRMILGCLGGGAERVLSAWQNPLTRNNNADVGHTHSSRLAAPTDSVIGGAGFAWMAKTIRAACWAANGAGGENAETGQGELEGEG